MHWLDEFVAALGKVTVALMHFAEALRLQELREESDMTYDETMAMVDFLVHRMRPLRWLQWPDVTWPKMKSWALRLGYRA